MKKTKEKVTVEKLVDSAIKQGWNQTLSKTLWKKENDEFLRLNIRDKKKIKLEKKIIYTKDMLKKLKESGKPCKTHHWEIIKEARYENVIITASNIKL